ncbi:T9SS type A sorting domain-containing protein [candidate division KSB1 bacterium]|nr:T9SS type A sorting domain-containing protein [candidate division KSB1 bacterium]
MRPKIFCLFLLYLVIAVPHLSAKTLNVPADYKTIQEAIDAASPGDTVSVSAGRYDETLDIRRSLVISGSGSGSCVLFKSSTDNLHVNIREATVEIRGMELNGGIYNSKKNNYDSSTRNAIQADFSTLILYDVQFNQYINFVVTVKRGFLYADHVSMQTREVRYQCDIGFSLVACVAEIDHFNQEFGWIDHTIDVNPGSFLGPSSLDIKNSTIWASHKTWGDCIRIYKDVLVNVDSCTFYRAPDGDKPDPGHTGITIAASEKIGAKITNNTFTGIPWAISFYGAAVNSNQALVENNLFQDCAIGGVRIFYAHSPGIDLGGGHLGSRGRNRFINSATFDVKLESTFGDVLALYNWWSFGDPAIGIWDKHDDPQSSGEVIYRSFPMAPRPQLPPNESLHQSVFSQFVWESAGSAFYYHLQVATDWEFENVVIEVPELVDNQYDPGELELSTVYYWRVMAFNAEGPSEWSEVFCFQTSDFYPPPPPEPVSPDNGAERVNLPVSLVWAPVEGEVWYFVEVSPVEYFNPVVISDSIYMGNEMFIQDIEPERLHFWRVRAKGMGGFGPWSPVFSFTTATAVTAVQIQADSKPEFKLSPAYPNPFNASTTIPYGIVRETRVKIMIYSVTGQVVEEVDLGRLGPGEYHFFWNAGLYPSGVYFYRIRTEYFNETGKCLYVK